MVDDEYVEDVFDYTLDDDLIGKRKRRRKATNKSQQPKHVDKSGKPKKLSKAVQAMQDRYDAIAANENATAKDWQEFFNSIEKFIMRQAYVVNFKHYVEKDSDLWGHLVTTLMAAIIPKRNPDGTRSCWYIDPQTQKVKVGYDPAKSNIGNFLLNTTKWTIVRFNKAESDIIQTLTDVSAEPIPDEIEDEPIDNDIYMQLPTKIDTRGDITKYRKELNNIWQMRQLSV